MPPIKPTELELQLQLAREFGADNPQALDKLVQLTLDLTFGDQRIRKVHGIKAINEDGTRILTWRRDDTDLTLLSTQDGINQFNSLRPNPFQSGETMVHSYVLGEVAGAHGLAIFVAGRIKGEVTPRKLEALGKQQGSITLDGKKVRQRELSQLEHKIFMDDYFSITKRVPRDRGTR